MTFRAPGWVCFVISDCHCCRMDAGQMIRVAPQSCDACCEALAFEHRPHTKSPAAQCCCIMISAQHRCKFGARHDTHVQTGVAQIITAVMLCMRTLYWPSVCRYSYPQNNWTCKPGYTPARQESSVHQSQVVKAHTLATAHCSLAALQHHPEGLDHTKHP